MKLGIIISQTEAETVWNAYRLAIYALEKGDSVKVFLLGSGVESEKEHPEYHVKEMIARYLANGGELFACGICMKSRNIEPTETRPMSSLKVLYEITRDSDRVLTF